LKSVAVFHGSPRKGNTHIATGIFLDEFLKHGDVRVTEFFMPKDLPDFCTGCTLCFSGQQGKCPNAQHIAPIMNEIISADALVFATPHYGACSMPGAMKTLFDHIDFLVLNVSPRDEMFSKKAFIITTGAGSTAAIRPIKSFLIHCGINRVFSLGLRILTDKWDKMPAARQAKYENALRQAANKFYKAKKGRPYISTILYYGMVKHIMRKYVGEGNYPYENWKEKGYFKKRPF
jgi:multimeric flavodoxin WrbA